MRHQGEFGLRESVTETSGSPENDANTIFRSGYIAIAGRPNTGKSTFLNRVLGRKAAIVTPKAQTTRGRVLGVCERPGAQLIFLDTPGIHDPGRILLNQMMVRTAYEACREADVTLYFVEAGKGVTSEDGEILERLNGTGPVILVFNKVDRTPSGRLMERLSAIPAQARERITEVVPISALNGRNVERLLDLLPGFLPEGPRYYPAGQWTDQPESFIIAEVIREKLFMHLRQELPYALAVRVISWSERSPPSRVRDLEAHILVARESQKGIVIGHRGEGLKRVGAQARQELEKLFGSPIFMQLQVRVEKEWNGDPRLLADLGYVDPEADADYE
ncbi:MAG: GTPase Era [Magnetococcales bacterium]|nr:GTPase Era [Magnetococcales bacterium]